MNNKTEKNHTNYDQKNKTQNVHKTIPLGYTPHRPKSAFLQDRYGNNSSTRLLSTIAAIIAFLIAIAAVAAPNVNPTTILPLVITLLSYSASHKGLNTYFENMR